MSQFDDETAVTDLGDGRFETQVSGNWNIGDKPNGGYALIPVLRAMASMTVHADPLTVTTHYLRPLTPLAPADIEISLARTGRTLSTLTGTLSQGGKTCLMVMAGFGDLAEPSTGSPDDDGARSDPRFRIDLDPVDLPPPDQCVARSGNDQGIPLPILTRIDGRLHPRVFELAQRPVPVVEGWIRLRDGAPPTALTLPFFADAFPPPLMFMLGNIGWVPTVELTVHVRRRPRPGWIRARFECDDLVEGRMIETGTLWDEDGAVVARSRQIGLLLMK